MRSLVTRCLACWLVLMLLCAWKPPEGPFTTEVIGVERIRMDMSIKGVDVDVVWARCGYPNGLYFSGFGLIGDTIVFPRTIVLCTELTQVDPAIARFIMAHEMGHAIIHQRGLAIPVGEEAAADEIAYLYLGLVGRTDDMLKVADFWLRRGRMENPFDPHPSDIRRGLMGLCMAAGSVGVANEYCIGGEWTRAKTVWSQLLRESL